MVSHEERGHRDLFERPFHSCCSLSVLLVLLVLHEWEREGKERMRTVGKEGDGQERGKGVEEGVDMGSERGMISDGIGQWIQRPLQCWHTLCWLCPFC